MTVYSANIYSISEESRKLWFFMILYYFYQQDVVIYLMVREDDTKDRVDVHSWTFKTNIRFKM